MYNSLRPNRSRYNRGLPPKTAIVITSNAEERLEGWITAGRKHAMVHRTTEVFAGPQAKMRKGYLRAIKAEAWLTGKATGALTFLLSSKGAEELTGNSHAGFKSNTTHDTKEEIKGKVHLGINYYSVAEAGEELLAKAVTVGVRVSSFHEGYEVLNGYVSFIQILEEVLYIDGSLAPGDVLIIDSEEYNVWLNNQEAIHMHRGDWIRVNRGTKIVFSGVGEAEMEVFYIAKYL